MSDRLPNLLPALDAATEAALRASIELDGVVVPVVVDQHDRILDGHHRSRIARELGVGCPMTTVYVTDEEHARRLAVELNTNRRQMTTEQRRSIVASLREMGHSVRAISAALGSPRSTVHDDIGAQPLQVSGSGHLERERAIGLDGKSYPAAKPAAQEHQEETVEVTATAQAVEWPHGYGYCHCGCGEKTSIAPQTKTSIGHVKGEPVRYAPGHTTRGRKLALNPTNAAGLTRANAQADRLRGIAARASQWSQLDSAFDIEALTSSVITNDERAELARSLGDGIAGLRKLKQRLENA